MEEPVIPNEISSDDRLWAALSWLPVTPLWPILAILALLMEDTKKRAFIRYHAVVSITTGAVLIPISIVTCGLGALVYFVFFYWAYLAYQGQMVEIPVISGFVRQQGWVP
ncbi:MAG: hypothetical protein AB1894_14925 [Chloroflexota bacterium]